MVDKEEAVNKTSNRSKIMLIAFAGFGLVLLLAGMVFSLVYIMKSGSEIKVTVEEKVPVQAATKGKEDGHANADTATKDEKEKPEQAKSEPGKEEQSFFGKGKPQFYKFKPTFVVTIPDVDKIRYIQLDIELMTRNSGTIEGIESLAPLIRNDLINLLSSQNYDEVITPEGKERLRAKALEIVQTILNTNLGKADVEQVLFTNFVTQ